MTPAALADLVRSCADDVLTRRGLDPAALPATVTVERPRHPDQGDYATNVALLTAQQAGVAPGEFACWLAEAVGGSPAVCGAEVAGPGFLNLRLTPAAHGEIIREVLCSGESFGITGLACAEPERGGPLSAPWAAADDMRYAHARLASLVRNAADLGVASAGAQLELLEHEQEGELIRTLGEFPRIVASATRSQQLRRVTRYLERLAGRHHIFVDPCPMLPMGDEEPGPLHTARLALCRATRQVLANGLGLLGVSAPERM